MVQQGHTASVTALAVSAKGAFAISADQSGRILFWDLAARRLVRALPLQKGSVRSLALSSRGDLAISFAGGETGGRVWSMTSGTQIGGISPATWAEFAVVGAEETIIGSTSDAVTVWHAKSLRVRASLQGSLAAIAPNGRKALIVRKNGWIVWDLLTSSTFPSPAKQKPCDDLQFADDDAQVVCLDVSKVAAFFSEEKPLEARATFFELRSGRIVRETNAVMKPDTDGDWLLKGLRLFANGRLAVTVWGAALGHDPPTIPEKPTFWSDDNNTDQDWNPEWFPIVVWDTHSGRKVATLKGHRRYVDLVAVGSWGGKILSGSQDRSVRLWNVDQVLQNRVLPGWRFDIRAVAISSDDRWVAAGSNDNTAKLWDARTGALVRVLRFHENNVRSVAFIGRSNDLLSGSADTSVVRWSAKDWQMLGTFHDHRPVPVTSYGSGNITLSVLPEQGVASLSVTRDGSRFLSGADDRTVKLWHVETGELLRTFRGHSSAVSAIRFFPNETNFASSSLDRSIRIWDIAVGSEVAVAHTSASITQMSISPSGTLLASLDSEGEVRIWDARRLLQLRSLEGKFVSIAFEPTRGRLLGGSAAGLHEFDFETGRSELLTNDLTDANAVAVNATGEMLLALHKGRSTIRIQRTAASPVDLVASQSNQEAGLAYTPDGYYRLSGPSAVHAVAFRKGLRAYGFDQFDLRFNRPDIVLQRLNTPEEIAKDRELREKISRYKAYWEYRVRQNGFDPVQLSAQKEIHAPEVFDIRLDGLPRDPVRGKDGKYGASAPAETAKRSVDLTFRIKDEAGKHCGGGKQVCDIIGYRIYVNGVPVDGQYVTRTKPTRILSVKRTITLSAHGSRSADQDGVGELAQGDNHIEISGTTADGVKSNRESVYIRYTGPDIRKKPKLYLLTLGIDEYPSSSGFSKLSYAVKDAGDVAAAFWAHGGRYSEVIAKSYRNGEVTRDRIRELGALLKKTTVDDTVIVFLAGHGMRATTDAARANEMLRLTYGAALPATLRYEKPASIFYYMTADSSAHKPWEKAIPLDMIRMMLDGIPARQKVLLIDACNSGEDPSTLGSEPSQYAKQEAEKQVAVLEKEHPDRARGWARGEGDRRGVVMRIAASIDQREMAELFPELRRGTGTVEISASTASQSAYEDKSWGNGAFTYTLKKAMTEARAKDGTLSAGALRKYVFEHVGPLTGGRQQPMVARDLPGRDFVLVGK